MPHPLVNENTTDVAVIIENGVRLRLNIVDTPGYGDQINNDNCWDPIVKYVSLAVFHPDSNRAS